MEKNYLIYKHTAPTGKSYIGQTNNLHRRNIVHKNTGGCRAFAAAIKKYGWESFTTEVLADGLTLDEANVLEAKLIAEHGTVSPGGYNLRSGGNNAKHSAESMERMKEKRALRPPMAQATRAKISEAMRNASPAHWAAFMNAARNKSPETSALLSAANKGRKHSDEMRARASAASLAQSAETREKQRRARLGKTWSPEIRARMSESAKLRWELSPRGPTSPETKAKMSAAHIARRDRLRAEVKEPQEGLFYTQPIAQPEAAVPE